MNTGRPEHSRLNRRSLVALATAISLAMLPAAIGVAAAPASAAVRPGSAQAAAAPGGSTNSLESAASKAGETGRKVAMSLLALGFAVAAIVLAFKRDFKEAAGVFAVGIVAVLLATPAGLNLLQDTVGSLFGGQ